MAARQRVEHLQREDLAAVADREDQPHRRRKARRQRLAQDREDRCQARAAGEAEQRAQGALGQPEGAVGPMELERAAEPVGAVQPAARLAALVARDEELEQAVGRQALAVGRGRDRIGPGPRDPGRSELDVHAGAVAQAHLRRQRDHQAADRGRQRLGGEHGRGRLERCRRLRGARHRPVGADHQRRGERLALADQALAGGLLLVGDGEAHHPAVVDRAFEDLGLAGAAGAAPAVVRQADAGGEPGIEDQLARRAAERLPGAGDGHPAAAGRDWLRHRRVPLGGRRAAARNFPGPTGRPLGRHHPRRSKAGARALARRRRPRPWSIPTSIS